MRGKRNRTHRRSFGTLTLMVVLVALVTLLGAGTALAANHWTDITDQQWIDVYHVSAADAFTVAEGYPDGTFRPDQAVTRGQLAKMGVGGVIPLYDPAIPTFSDVSPDSIFYQYIEGAVAAGVISGYPDGTYRPQNNIARQQTNSILGSWLSQQEIAALGGIQGAHGFYSSLATWFAAEGEGVLSQFADRLMVEPVHRPATAYLVMRGVVLGSSSGASTYLKPLSELTRAQAVTMMLRAMAVVFQADLPTVTIVNPTAGPTAGGNSVVITGTNFVSVTAVKFGTVNATSYVVNSATQITAVAPAGVSSPKVDVIVTNPVGPSVASAASKYSYATPTLVESLGKQLFFDTRLSEPAGQACAACHDASVGYTGGDETIDAAGAVYEGATAGRFGNRKPPAAAYAGGSPVFADLAGTFTGGMFWDGRATGSRLGDPLAEQAGGPFLNPLEQNNPSMAVVVDKVRIGPYASLFIQVWGQNAFDDTQKAYDFISRSIAAYERSGEVSRFDSRFDTYRSTGQGLTEEEKLGLSLFEGKANCANCHVTTADQAAGGVVFTDYTYDNLGIPKNPGNPFYSELAVNPSGAAWIDLGLGGFLETVPALSSQAGGQMGKFKVPTLRNVDKRPDPGFVKAYGHNGYFKSLDEIVHFYNTRDIPGAGWPAPEYAATMNTTEMGNLGLTPAEETAIVAFLKTLTDR